MTDRAYAKAQAQQKTSSGSSPKSSLLQRTCACGQHTIAGGECDACRREQSVLHRSQRAFGPPPAPGAVPGSSLAEVNGTAFNAAFDSASRFGHDFSRIPVHAPAQEHGTAFNAAFDSASRLGHDFRQIPTHSPAAGALQAKLAINKPGDEYEQEADRIADQVLAAPAHHGVSGAPPRIQRFSGKSNGQMDAAPTSVDQTLASHGRPLEPALRQDMEQRFGYDFSRVRVHSDAAAEQSAQDVNAHAYTVGHDLVFGAGRFAVGTQEGRRLIAHELTHVVQQNSGMTVVQRAPADDTRWSRDEAAARYRGQLMARRIRNHGKLSKEARAKINRELAYFEGSAKEAYLKEVRPALLAVTEIEMPEEQVVPRGPQPIRLSLLKDDPQLGSFTDEMSDAFLTEAEQRDKDELALVREREMEKLRQKTKDWRPEDQAFALDLLRSVLQNTNTTNIDPRGVSDKIRQPILDHLRKGLREVNQRRLDACKANDPGILAKTRGRFNNDDPCVDWFQYDDSRSHGPSELADLERHLRSNRFNSDGTQSPAECVYYDVFEYRKKADPFMLEQEQMASGMVNAGLGIAGAVGEKINPGGRVPPVITAEEGKVVSGKPPVLSEPPKPSFGPDSKPIQGGSQKTPQQQDHLVLVDPDGTLRTPTQVKPPPAPAPGGIPNRPTGTHAANDNVTQQGQEIRQQKVTADGGGTTTPPPPKMVRKIVPSPPIKPKVGSVKPSPGKAPAPRRQKNPLNMQEHPVKATEPPDDTHAVRPTIPGETYQRRSAEIGNFAEKNYNNLPDTLRGAGIPPSSKPIPGGRIPPGAVISGEIPKDAVKYRIKGYRGSISDRDLPEIDALDRAGGRVIEIKPDHRYDEGLAEAQAYAYYMDQLEPLPPVMGPDGKLIQPRWKAVCETYDFEAVGQYVDQLRPLPETSTEPE